MIIETLDYLTLLKITGDDAASFLQGQLTNDIELATKQWQYSGYCSPKGRLLALFTIWRNHDGIFALIDNSLVESTLKRLRMYVMRSKVVIEEVESHQYAILKPSQDELVKQGILSEEITNKNNYDFVTQSNNHCLFFDNRLLIIAPSPIEIETINQDKQQHWLQEDIKTGLPQVNEQSAELFIPQMLNLDILNGINFKKGCYTGQEIVARMHYLGKLKQRMFVCTLHSNKDDKNPSENIKAGDKIYKDTLMTAAAGNIVSANHNIALAVLRLDSVEEGNQDNVFFSVNEDTILKVNEAQPYSLNIK